MSIAPRRIMYVDHTAILSGGELALLNLVRHLDSSRFKPIVVLFSPGPLVEKLCEAGIETHVLPLADTIVNTRKDSLRLGTLFKLRQVFTTAIFTVRLAFLAMHLKVELIHANSLKADIIGGLAGRLAGIKIIWHIRDRIADDYLPTVVAKVFRQLCTIVPHFVVANSQATMTALGGINPKKAAVVNSGSTLLFADRRYQVVHDGMRAVHRGTAGTQPIEPEREVLVGMVGRISPWKGQHIFLQAAAAVRGRFPNVRFQIVGGALFAEHAFETEIHVRAASLGLLDVVEFTGFRGDVAHLIAAMDILVHASTIGEPFGQVVIEGMAAGKPVVATNGGGIPEIVQDGITGILVPMGDAEKMADAICQLIADPQRAFDMGCLGYERVMKFFTIQQTVANVERIYDRLLPPFTIR